MSLLLLGAGSAGAAGLYPSLLRVKLWLERNYNTNIGGSPAGNGEAIDSWISRSSDAQDFQPGTDAPVLVTDTGLQFTGDDMLIISEILSITDGFFAISFKTHSSFSGDECLFSQANTSADNVYWRLLIDTNGYLCIADRNGVAAENRVSLQKLAASTTYNVVMRQGAVVLMLTEDGYGMTYEDGAFMFYEDSTSLWLGDIAGDAMTIGAATDSGGEQDYFTGFIRHVIAGEDELSDSLETWLLNWMANN